MFKVEFEENWIMVRILGTPSAADMVRAMAQVPRFEGNLMIDVRSVGVSSGTEHALLGSEMASRFPRVTRIALVVDEDLITYNSERAARRAGTDLRVFTTMDDARRWLAS